MSFIQNGISASLKSNEEGERGGESIGSLELVIIIITY